MSNKTSLIITSTDTNGKQSNKTLTDINPATSSASLKAFAQGLIGLTDNTYDSSALVERNELDVSSLPFASVIAYITDSNFSTVYRTFNLPGTAPDGNGYFNLFTTDQGVIHDTTNNVYKIYMKIDASNSGGIYLYNNAYDESLDLDGGFTQLTYNVLASSPNRDMIQATLSIPDSGDKWKTAHGITFYQDPFAFTVGRTRFTQNYDQWAFYLNIGEGA